MDSKKENVINIICASDDNYSIMLCAMIKSIELNHKTNECIDFYIIDNGITDSNKKKIINTVKSKKINLIWKKVTKKILDNLKVNNDLIKLTTHYYRLFIPYLVSKNIDKIIYLDCDLLVLEDISKLWNCDIKNHICGAVQGPWVPYIINGVPNYKELGINPYSKYFNSGVLLINLNKWKNEKISQKVINTTIQNKSFVKYRDQYAMNVVLIDKWKQLDIRWNRFAKSYYVNDPSFIIHYLSTNPISLDYFGGQETIFFSYLDKTPWKNWRPYKKINKSMIIKERNQLPNLLNQLELKGIGVEIGVQNGIFSEKILSDSNLKTLYSIDPWIEFKKEDYVDIANVSQEQQDYRYLKTILKLIKFKNRSVVMRTTSKEAANIFKDKSLDFVYIDALHSYEGCKEDIKIWWSKLKRGGLFAGHDYLNGKIPAGDFGVKKAVDEFVKEKKLKLFVTEKSKDYGFPSWYLIKD